MGLYIAVGNVLDEDVDGLILTVDGARLGLEGNIARQFARRYPDDWEDVASRVRYPLPLGRAMGIACTLDAPFKMVVIASTLHHLDVFSDTQKLGIIRSACSEAIAIASRSRLRSLAAAVMRGGWRLGTEEAFGAMVDASGSLAGLRGGLDLRVVVSSQDEAHVLTEVATRRGINLKVQEK